MRLRRGRAPALLLLALAGGCDPRQEADALAAKASAEAKSLESAATKKAGELSADAKSAARKKLDASVAEAKRKLFGLAEDGKLSDGAKAWLRQRSSGDNAAGEVEAVVAKGAQLAPVAVDAAGVLNAAVDDETAIEPIYQKVPQGEEAKLDASIAAMPRVEVVEGVKIGFKKLDLIETDKVVKEQAVLVLWRKDDTLLGFLYRSKRTIDLDKLVKEAPRLIKLTEGALQ